MLHLSKWDSYLPSSNQLHPLQEGLHNVAGLLTNAAQPVLGKVPLSYIWLYLCLFGRGRDSRWDRTSPSHREASQHSQSLFVHPAACDAISNIPAGARTGAHRQEHQNPRAQSDWVSSSSRHESAESWSGIRGAFPAQDTWLCFTPCV